MDAILTTRNLTWEQYFTENNLVADKMTTKLIKHYETQGYVAVGFGLGLASVPVLLMDDKTRELGRFVELYFKNGKKIVL
jgi:hypothetical protein